MNRLQDQLDRPRFPVIQPGQVLQQPLEQHDLVSHPVQHLVAERLVLSRAAEQRIDGGSECSQWPAQLMHQIGQQAALLNILSVKALDQNVEGLDKLLHLLDANFRHRHQFLAGGHRLHFIDELVDGPDEIACQDQRQDDAQQQSNYQNCRHDVAHVQEVVVDVPQPVRHAHDPDHAAVAAQSGHQHIGHFGVKVAAAVGLGPSLPAQHGSDVCQSQVLADACGVLWVAGGQQLSLAIQQHDPTIEVLSDFSGELPGHLRVLPNLWLVA